jgi:hypothetical protein
MCTDNEHDPHITLHGFFSGAEGRKGLKEGSRVRQKHNSLGIVFIAAIATLRR